jgi:transcriptional regulator of met regulon
LKDLRDELGVKGGRYDFAAQDIKKKQAAYQKAKLAKNEKERSVNKQVCSIPAAVFIILDQCSCRAQHQYLNTTCNQQLLPPCMAQG